jgi:acetamidase/formamidase
MAEHFLDASAVQPWFDRDAEPRLVVESGDVVVLECPEPCGQVTPEWSAADFEHWDASKVHALLGPIAIRGLRAGQTLAVHVVEVEHGGWGWAGHLRGFGLLAEQFDHSYIQHWHLADGQASITASSGDPGLTDAARRLRVPIAAFPGCIGVAPAEPSRNSTLVPGPHAGNIDLRDAVAGSTVLLPTFVDGGLLSLGDCHAAQGDGEVAGTGLESPMRLTVRLERVTGRTVRQLQVHAPPRPAALEHSPRHITTGIGPDPVRGARDAVTQMIQWLGEEHGLSPSEAYVLCSVAADLRMSQVVDMPNHTVTLHLPLSVLG